MKRRKGAAADGLRFERRFGKYLQKLGFAARTDWIEFWDRNGHGFAHPDYFLELPHSIVLFECKLSQTEAAWHQMLKLYVPLLMDIFARPVTCVQVTRTLRTLPDGVIEDPFPAVTKNATGKCFTLHWLG